MVCHKDTAQGTQSPLLCRGISCLSLLLYGIRIGCLHAGKGSIIGAGVRNTMIPPMIDSMYMCLFTYHSVFMWISYFISYFTSGQFPGLHRSDLLQRSSDRQGLSPLEDRHSFTIQVDFKVFSNIIKYLFQFLDRFHSRAGWEWNFLQKRLVQTEDHRDRSVG